MTKSHKSAHPLANLAWAGLVALAIAGLFYAFLPRPIQVDVAHVRRANLTVTVNREGKTRIKERYIVSSPFPGKMRRIALRAGDPVRAGETIITEIEPLDPDLLDERARAQADARVKAADAALARSEALLQRARTSLEYASVELERAQTLFESKSISHQELDNLEEKKRAAAEDKRSADHAVRIAGYELDLARAALLRASRTRGESDRDWILPIVAPTSGKVLRFLHEDASAIGAGAPLAELGDPADLEMEIDLLSTDAVKVRPGARVFVENWGGPRPLHGRVRLVEPAAFTKISALGVEEQRVNVMADFAGDPSDHAALGDAFRIEARIVVGELTDALVIPAAALFKLGGQWLVFCVQNDRAELRRVELRSISQAEAAISGLHESDLVILYPSDRIRSGKKVAARRNLE